MLNLNENNPDKELKDKLIAILNNTVEVYKPKHRYLSSIFSYGQRIQNFSEFLRHSKDEDIDKNAFIKKLVEDKKLHELPNNLVSNILEIICAELKITKDRIAAQQSSYNKTLLQGNIVRDQNEVVNEMMAKLICKSINESETIIPFASLTIN